jgi:hypothetical protein
MKKDTVENFTKITKFQLQDYYTDIDYFFRKIYPSFISFYSGKSIEPFGRNNYSLLQGLIGRSNILSNAFSVYSDSFQTVDYWELMDFTEDIRSKLLTANKIDKYLRSSISAGKTILGFEYNYTLNNGQTIEAVSSQVLNSNNPDNDWTSTAMNNDLKEVDYSIEGGKNLKLVNNSFQSNLVTSMIDNTIGEKIYGKDIDKNLTFENNDLRVLGYKETVFQTVDILSKLSKGDIPEFPTLGIDGSTYKGTNFYSVNYPAIIRDLERLFKTDDLFVDFQVMALDYTEGDINVEFSVGTKYDLVVLKTATI